MIKLAPCRAAAAGDRSRVRRRLSPDPCHPELASLRPTSPPRRAGVRPRALPAAARDHLQGPATLPFPLIGDHDLYMGSSIIYGRLWEHGSTAGPSPSALPLGRRRRPTQRPAPAAARPV